MVDNVVDNAQMDQQMTSPINAASAFPQLLVIADDLTGANDTGIAFANAGLETVVSILPSAALMLDDSVDVAVLSTHSRHLSPAKAHEQVTNALAPFRAAIQSHSNSQHTQPLVYKKIDSTLRGHPGAELQATMDSLGFSRALIAPAFPAQGRTTIDGQQRVHGVPLAESSFGREVPESEVAQFFAQPFAQTFIQPFAQPFTQPVPEGGLNRVSLAAVREGHDALAARFAQSTASLIVADAENDDDLLSLAAAGINSGFRLFCGSAGLANALTQVIELRPRAGGVDEKRHLHHPSAQADAGPMVVVAGSQHPQTARQVAALNAEYGPSAVVHLQPASIRQAADDSLDALLAAELDAGLAALTQNQHLVITTAGLDLGDLSGQKIAESLGQWVRRLLSQSAERNASPSGLILTGGDVAMAVCTALGASALRLNGEIEAGIPVGCLLDGPFAGLSLVTKAGGFGSDTLFVKAIESKQAGS